MKSQEKVKQQRRIRNIPRYCDNRLSKNDMYLEELVKRGQIILTKPQPRKVEKTPMRRMNRASIP